MSPAGLLPDQQHPFPNAPASSRSLQPALQAGSSTDCLREIAALWGLELPEELHEASSPPGSPQQHTSAAAADLPLAARNTGQRPQLGATAHQPPAPQIMHQAAAGLADLQEMAAVWGLKDAMGSSSCEDPAAPQQHASSSEPKPEPEPERPSKPSSQPRRADTAQGAPAGVADSEPRPQMPPALPAADLPRRQTEQPGPEAGHASPPQQAEGLPAAQSELQAQPQHSEAAHDSSSACQDPRDSGGVGPCRTPADCPDPHASRAAAGRAPCDSTGQALEQGSIEPAAGAEVTCSLQPQQGGSLDSLFETLSAELLSDLMGLGGPSAAGKQAQTQHASRSPVPSRQLQRPADAVHGTLSSPGHDQAADSSPGSSNRPDAAASRSDQTPTADLQPHHQQQPQQQQEEDAAEATADVHTDQGQDQQPQSGLQVRVDSALHLQLPASHR